MKPAITSPLLHFDLALQAALAREASEFVACQERATSNGTAQQTPTATDLQNRHESWWRSTVLAVAHMVSTTGLGAVPWRGAATIGNSSDNPGRSARLQLGSAEVAAKIPAGYDRDEQVCAKQSRCSSSGGRGRLGGGQCERESLACGVCWHSAGFLTRRANHTCRGKAHVRLRRPPHAPLLRRLCMFFPRPYTSSSW